MTFASWVAATRTVKTKLELGVNAHPEDPGAVELKPDDCRDLLRLVNACEASVRAGNASSEMIAALVEVTE